MKYEVGTQDNKKAGDDNSRPIEGKDMFIELLVILIKKVVRHMANKILPLLLSLDRIMPLLN